MFESSCSSATGRENDKKIFLFKFLVSSSSIVVEYLTNHPKIKGLSPTAAAITVSEKDMKNIHSKIWSVAVAQW